MGIWNPSNTCFLGPTLVHNPNGISIGLAVFAQDRADYPILYNRRPFLPKLPLPIRGSGTQSNNGSLGPPKSLTHTASRSVQRFLHGSLLWKTDRPHYSVC